jgi:hypothetical protein
VYPVDFIVLIMANGESGEGSSDSTLPSVGSTESSINWPSLKSAGLFFDLKITFEYCTLTDPSETYVPIKFNGVSKGKTRAKERA